MFLRWNLFSLAQWIVVLKQWCLICGAWLNLEDVNFWQLTVIDYIQCLMPYSHCVDFFSQQEIQDQLEIQLFCCEITHTKLMAIKQEVSSVFTLARNFSRCEKNSMQVWIGLEWPDGPTNMQRRGQWVLSTFIWKQFVKQQEYACAECKIFTENQRTCNVLLWRNTQKAKFIHEPGKITTEQFRVANDTVQNSGMRQFQTTYIFVHCRERKHFLGTCCNTPAPNDLGKYIPWRKTLLGNFGRQTFKIQCKHFWWKEKFINRVKKSLLKVCYHTDGCFCFQWVAWIWCIQKTSKRS